MADNIGFPGSAPHSLEAERAVLGAILVNNRLLDRVLPIIGHDDFYRESHRRIFRVMEAMSAASSALDPVTLGDALAREGDLESVGGLAYISSLLAGVPRLANAEHHAQIVKEKSLLRRLIETSTRIAKQAQMDEEPAEVLLDDAERSILRLGEDRIKSGFVPIEQVTQTVYAMIEKLTDRKEMVTGVATGYVELDELTSGLQPSELIILAARPSMGKTAFALNITENAALRHEMKVGIFSLEMAREQLVMRMIGSQSRLDLHRMRTGRLSQEELTRVVMAVETLNEASIFIDDSGGIGVMEMRAKARRLQSDHGLDLLVIDYLQLLRGSSRYDSRQQEISEISRSLKELAKELRCPVLALSQLSRAPEVRREDRHRPRLSDLRECLAGATLVADPVSGEERSIAQWHRQGRPPRILTLDAAGRLAVAQAAKVVDSGEKDLLLLETASGRRIRASADHPFLTPAGWLPLERLAAGAAIAVPATAPAAAACEGGVPPSSWAARAAAADLRLAAPPARETAAAGVAFAEIPRPPAAGSPVAWDPVAEILPAGRGATYDLVVPGSHNFVANGIIVHNSGAIEQDADVVMFIYRPEIYYPDKEDLRGRAEIIIGKQRNGPIDTVHLAFLRQYSRFENAAFGRE